MEFEEPTFDDHMDGKIGFLSKETKGIEFEELMENEV